MVRERWAPRIALVVVLATALWACGLSVLGTRADEPETGDATSTDGSSLDASSDVTSSLDALSGDADAADAPPDAPVTFCTKLTPMPTFCADFDDPADASPSAGWGNPSLDAGASLTSSVTVYASAPRSLHSTSTQGSSAVVEQKFPMTSRISVDFDVRFTALPATGDVSTIRLTPPVFPGMDVYYFVYSTGSYFQEFGDDYSAALAAPTLDAWHHVAIAITTNGVTSTITASMDGAAGWTNHTLLHTWPTPTTALLQLGLADLYLVNSSEVFIDNVVVRVQ